MVTWNERDVEDYLHKHPESFKFGWANRCVTKWIARQMKLPSGILDLLGVSEHGVFVLVEIKNVPADSCAIAQVCRYAEDLNSVIDAANDYNEFLTPVYKVVLYPKNKGVPNNVMFEANAMDVELREFECSVNIEINQGYLAWTDEKRKSIKQERLELSKNKIFEVDQQFFPPILHKAEEE